MAKKEPVTSWLGTFYLKPAQIKTAPDTLRAWAGASIIIGLILFILSVMVSSVLLVRLALDALFLPSPAYQETAKNFVLTFASAFGAPFLVWRAWIAHRQANAASEQARVAVENHITG